MQATPRRRRWLERLHQEELQRMAVQEAERACTYTGFDDLALTSSWMRRTGWARMFKDADRRLLKRLSLPACANGLALSPGRGRENGMESPAGDEHRLLLVGRAVDLFFDRCEDTVRHTDHSILCWLRGHFPDRPFKAPFQLPGRKPTIRRYRSLWKSFLWFVLRLFRLDQPVRRELLCFKPTPGQSVLTAEFWNDGWWEENLSAEKRPDHSRPSVLRRTRIATVKH